MHHPPPGVRLRSATLDDVPACARLHMDCWRVAYGQLVDPGAPAGRPDVAWFEESWRTRLERGRGWLLAESGDAPIGFAASGPSRDDDAPTPLELYALYVAEPHRGAGVGRLLLAEELGGEDASLWVLEADVRSLGFYARQGFRPDGLRRRCDAPDAREVRMVRMVRPGGHPVRA